MNNLATSRIVALVDMDCFYCQVEARLNPTLRGKPMAVVQYNQWKGGGIIAVNYEARDKGVTRGMRGDEAKEKCPEIALVSVPTIRGKADLSKYRDAGDEVAAIFSEFSDCVQRASIDEAYLDLTKAVEDYIKLDNNVKLSDLQTTYIVGYCDLKTKSEDKRVEGLSEWLKLIESEKIVENSNYKLAVGGIIVEKMRSKIYEKTEFHCSAGIAHNKILAKLTAGLHKPKKQTILPHDSVPELFETVPIKKVRNLGGKLGKHVSEKLSISFMSELYKFSLQELQQKFDEKTSSWLYNIAKGIDLDPVTPRLKPESVGCCKNFSGLNMLTKKDQIKHWLKELSTEISERLHKDCEKNKRRAKLLTVSFCQDSAMSRCGPLNSYDVNKIAQNAFELIKKFNSAPSESNLWKPPVKYLGLSVSKFVEAKSIEKFFTARSSEVNEKELCSKSVKIESKVNSEKLETYFPSTKTEDDSKLAMHKPSTSEYPNPESSFFLKFLNEKKMLAENLSDKKRDQEFADNETQRDGLEDSISNIGKEDKSVIQLFPESLKRFDDKVNSSNENEKERNGDCISGNSIGLPQSFETDFSSECASETCNECGKSIPLDIFLEHLDYHVALKINSELNKDLVTNTHSINQPRAQKEIQAKRKKVGAEKHPKKMRSITSFFAVIPK